MAKVASPIGAAPRLAGWSGRWGALRVSPATVLLLLFTALVGFLVIYPLVMLVIGGFAQPLGSRETGWTLDGYRTALGDADARRAMGTTLWLSFVRASLAVGLAVFMSWAITRTNLPGRRLFHNLLLLSFFLPFLPQIAAWSLLLSPRSGLINQPLQALFGLSSGPFNIFSYGGIIFLSVLGWSAFLYLIISPAFLAMDASLEESARTCGAGHWTIVRKVTAPLLLPAILGAFSLAFVRMMESFETELFLGAPAGIYVFTTQIYYYLHGAQLPAYGPAIALSMVLIVITSVMVALQTWLLGKRSYVTVSGRGYRARETQLGRSRYGLLAFFVVLFTIKLALPLFVLVLGSFQKVAGVYNGQYTLEHWRVLGDERIWEALRRTVLVGLVAATVGMVVCVLISYIVIRTRFVLRRVLDLLTWAPYTVPSFVLSLGFLWAVLKGIETPFVLYGTLTLLMIVFVVRGLPIGTRVMNGTMIQLAAELEEAARLSGASWFYSFRRIVLPLLRPSLIIGWLIFMMTVLRDLSTVILLYGPKSKLLSIVFFEYWRTGGTEKAAVLGLLMTAIGLLFVAGIRLIERATGASATRAV